MSRLFEFPFGAAALWILVLALISGGAILASSEEAQEKPDLIFATFTKEHAAAYRPAIEEFEKANDVKIQLQVVDQRALQSRLQASFQVGADVPDMVEVMNPTLSYFIRGPLEDVGFVDLTDKIKEEGLDKQLVESRFAVWSSRGRIFCLPHDIHPTMLVYNREWVRKLGIDVNELKTWDDFTRVGREITKDYNDDGVVDHYMIDLPADGGDILKIFLLQRGGGFFDAEGNVIFDNDIAVDTVAWYAKQLEGPTRISFAAGWGQPLSSAMTDGVIIFILAPDWRTRQFQADVPQLSGKLGLMPLPVWEEGGRRTSTWGGTGLAITKQAQAEGKFDLAWKLGMYLYLDPDQLGTRFRDTNILPPSREAWEHPAMNEPREFYGGQRLGAEYAALAPDVPAEYVSPYQNTAIGKFNEAFINTRLYYTDELLNKNLSDEEIDTRLKAKAREELTKAADRLRVVMNRNVFLSDDGTEAATAPDAATTPESGESQSVEDGQ